MTHARFRITIKSQAGTTISAENDAAAGALLLGLVREARDLRASALFLERDMVVLHTFNEPSPEQVQAFQALGDAYATAGASVPGRTFFNRVAVESLTSLSADDTAAALVAAKLASDQPGSSVTRPFAGGCLVVLFTPGNATATAELLPGDDIADPTPMFARDEATGKWVESDRNQRWSERGSNRRAAGTVSGPMTDPTHDPEMTPLSLVQQLRLTADDLTSTYVAVDADGDPIGERPLDGSEEDFDDPLEPVEFEPEALHDMAALYRNAADELEEAALLREQASAEIARLTEALGASADPPNRAPLLATLEEIAGPELASACGNGMVALIRDAIAAIRTDARVIEASRGALKGWHAWARKLALAEGDEYASARPERLQAIIEKRLETARLGASAKDVDALGNWLVTTFQPGHVDEEAVLMPRGEYESGAAFCRRVLQLALDRGAFSVSSGRIEGLRFEELPERPVVDALVATSMWELLEAIEKTDPTDTEMSKVQFRGTVRELAHRRHDLMTEEAARAGKTMSPWTAWARTVLGCDDGADAELQALIGRMLDTAKKLRRQNQLAFDALASGPLPMVAPSHPLDAQVATTADVAERARAAASNLRYAMGHPQESPDPTPAAMQDAVQVLTVAAAVLGATQADPGDAPRG